MLTSATIANPLSLAQELTGLEFDLVDRDGSERGEREVVMCNPPLIDERTMRRASSLGEAASLFADLVARRGAHDLLRAQPPRRRADLPVRAQAAGGDRPTMPTA